LIATFIFSSLRNGNLAMNGPQSLSIFGMGGGAVIQVGQGHIADHFSDQVVL